MKIKYTKILYYCMIMYFLSPLTISCKSKKIEPYKPTISVDTSAIYFSFVKKYIEQFKDKKSDTINKFIIQLFKVDSEYHIKIAAIKTINKYDKIPLSFFKFRENYIYIFTGIEDLLQFDSVYLNAFDKMIDNSNRWYSFHPRCWEIIYNNDTCYNIVGGCTMIEFRKPDFP